jgi:hypothetical protein
LLGGQINDTFDAHQIHFDFYKSQNKHLKIINLQTKVTFTNNEKQLTTLYTARSTWPFLQQPHIKNQINKKPT